MHYEFIENVAESIVRMYGVLTKRGKAYIVSDELKLVPLASPEVLHIIQESIKEEVGDTGDNGSVLEVLDLLYRASSKYKID